MGSFAFQPRERRASHLKRAEREAERSHVGLGNVINRFLEVGLEGEQVCYSDEELKIKRSLFGALFKTYFNSITEWNADLSPPNTSSSGDRSSVDWSSSEGTGRLV